MEDPYIFAETLDQKTLDYVGKCNTAFRSKFGGKSDSILDDVSFFHDSEKMHVVKLTDAGILVVKSREGKYHAYLDEKEIYSTSNIIFWAEADKDGKRIALFETGGSDRGTLTILHYGNIVKRAEGTFSGLLFSRDSYYLVKSFTDDNEDKDIPKNSHRVMKDGKVVFGDGLGPDDFISLYRSGESTIVSVGNWAKTKIYVGSLDNPESWNLIRDEQHSITPLGVKGEDLYLLENTGNGIITVNSRKIIEPDAPVQAAYMVENGILLIELENCSSVPVLYRYDGKKIRNFPMDIPLGLKTGDTDLKEAVLAMESFGLSYSLYKLNSAGLELVSENPVLDVEIEEKWVTSGNAKIHYFISSSGKKSKRTLVYGYGGFNIALSPMYMSTFAYLLKNGFNVAVANLRGGSEYGEEWHKAGTFSSKQNVFDDFKAVIEDIRKGGMEAVAYGASNGGLLVGAILTQSPEMIKGAVIGSPVLDMLRFHKMSVGRYWVTEYGDPDDPDVEAYLKRYSPYHNISEKVSYPPTLIYTRLKDDRVHPAHGIKFHMALSKISDKAYLRVNTEGGHIGITGNDMKSEIADICAFISSCFEEN